MSTDDDSRELGEGPPTERSLRVQPPDTMSFAERYAPLLEPTLIHRIVPRPEVTPATRVSSNDASMPKRTKTKRLALVAVAVGLLAVLGIAAARGRARGTSAMPQGTPGLATNGAPSAAPASVPSAVSAEPDEEPVDPRVSSEWLDDETLGRILADDEFAPGAGARTEADLVARAEREQVHRATEAVNAGMFGEAAQIYGALSAMRPDVTAYARAATILSARSAATAR